MPLPTIDPPLINSANPWATTEQDLITLYNSPHTGAVTTRTSLPHCGFAHNDSIHQFTFFEPSTQTATSPNQSAPHSPAIVSSHTGSLNTLGYSPLNLCEYLSIIHRITSTSTPPSSVQPPKSKPFIVSVTGSPSEISSAHNLLQSFQISHPHLTLCMELNLSCPNIEGQPPPAYNREALEEYLHLLHKAASQPPEALGDTSEQQPKKIAIGIKTPPYTYAEQFSDLINALAEVSSSSSSDPAIDFITATNTLGSSLVLGDGDGEDANGDIKAVLNSQSGLGIGGMAGAPLHPLALGNVKILRRLLDGRKELEGVKIIGTGGVADHAGFRRMRAAGAEMVGVGTALGREGVGIFERILGSFDGSQADNM